MENILFKKKIQKEYLVLSMEFQKFKSQYFTKTISKSKIQNYCRSSNFLAQITKTFTKNCSEYFDFNMKQNVCEMNTFIVKDLTQKLNFLVKENKQFQAPHSYMKSNICRLCSQQLTKIDVSSIKKQLQNDASNRLALMKKICNDMQKQEQLFSIEEDRNFFKLLNRRLVKKEQAVQIQSKQITKFIEEMTKSVNDLNFLTQYTPTNVDFNTINSSFQETLQINFKDSLQKNFKSKFPPWIQKLFFKLKQIIIKSLYKDRTEIGIQTQSQKIQTVFYLKQQLTKTKKQNEQLKQSIQQFKAKISNLQNKLGFMSTEIKNSEIYYMEQINKAHKQKKNLENSIAKINQKILQSSIAKINEKTPKKTKSSKIQEEDAQQKQNLIDTNQSFLKQQKENFIKKQEEQKQRQNKKKKKINRLKKGKNSLNVSNQLSITHQQQLSVNFIETQNENQSVSYDNQINKEDISNNIQSSQKIVKFLKNLKVKQKKNIGSINFIPKEYSSNEETISITNLSKKKLSSKEPQVQNSYNQNKKPTQNKKTPNHKREFSIQNKSQSNSFNDILKLQKKQSKPKKLKQRPSIDTNLILQENQQPNETNLLKKQISELSRKKIAEIGDHLQSKALDMLKQSAKHLPGQMKQYINHQISNKKKNISYFHRQNSLENQIQADNKQKFLFKQQKIDVQTQTEDYQYIIPKIEQKKIYNQPIIKQNQFPFLQNKNQKNMNNLKLQVIDEAEQYHRKKMLETLKKQNLVPGDLSISHYELLIKKIFSPTSISHSQTSRNYKQTNFVHPYKENHGINQKKTQKPLLILSLPKVQKNSYSKLSKTGRQKIILRNKNLQNGQSSCAESIISPDENKNIQKHIFNEKDFKLFIDQSVAYQYETRSKNNFHKKKVLTFTKSQYEYLQSLYKMISLIRQKNIEIYNKICSFLRYPYQTIKKSFQIVNISKQMSLQSFLEYFKKITHYHNQCIQKQNQFCSHFDIFVQKISSLVVTCSISE